MNLDASTQVPKRALEFTSAHIQTHTHTHMHTHAHTRACTHAHTHTHTCTYTRLHTHTHTLTLAHVLHTGPAGHGAKYTHMHTHTHPCSRPTRTHRPSRPWCRARRPQSALLLASVPNRQLPLLLPLGQAPQVGVHTGSSTHESLEHPRTIYLPTMHAAIKVQTVRTKIRRVYSIWKSYLRFEPWANP